MTRPARIPPEQPSLDDKGAPPAVDADVNLGAQGRFGDLKHNLTNQWKVQVR